MAEIDPTRRIAQNSADLTGQRFSKLVVLGRDRRDKWGYWRWLCRCDCGVEKSIAGNELRKGATKSCGCLRRAAPYPTWLLTHGQSYTREYRVWGGMHARCRNPKADGYQYYGGRGITVCQRWDSFENFIADMGPRPSPRHSIERNDNDGNYEPSNCRWATPKEQAANRRPGGPRGRKADGTRAKN